MTRDDLPALVRRLARLSPRGREALIAGLGPELAQALLFFWPLWARANQLPPSGAWRVWLMMAGRGFGKTRAGAEWVRGLAERDGSVRIALIGATLAEARAVMVEGESGLLGVAPPGARPLFEPSLRRLRWPNGAQAFLYSAEVPDQLRGPQHHVAWGDELAKWPHLDETWMNVQMGLRLGRRPQILVTTTPRPRPLLKRLLAEAEAGAGGVVVSRGRTADNAANLAPDLVAALSALYGGSRLGRQELDGVLVEDVDGALWSRALLERCRVVAVPALVRVVVAVDPPVSSGAHADACGIVAVGLGADGHGYVLVDGSVEKASPERWARAAVALAQSVGADRLVAEANNGGDMVGVMLRTMGDASVPVTLVHASRGKVARAEPVAALYEQGRVHHVGGFPLLEDEMCGLMVGGAYGGPGRSPDRADALVWAVSALMLGVGGRPGVRMV